MRRKSEAGFTLLEAIVAITVLTATLIPLYLLIATVSRSAFRLDESNRIAEIELDALNVMSIVNPMEKPVGAVDLGPYAVGLGKSFGDRSRGRQRISERPRFFSDRSL